MSSYTERMAKAREFAQSLDDDRLAALLVMGRTGVFSSDKAGADLTSLVSGARKETEYRRGLIRAQNARDRLLKEAQLKLDEASVAYENAYVVYTNLKGV